MMLHHDAIRHQLAHDNNRMREALRLIETLCVTSSEKQHAGALRDIARVARNAQLMHQIEDITLRHPEQKEGAENEAR